MNRPPHRVSPVADLRFDRRVVRGNRRWRQRYGLAHLMRRTPRPRRRRPSPFRRRQHPNPSSRRQDAASADSTSPPGATVDALTPRRLGADLRTTASPAVDPARAANKERKVRNPTASAKTAVVTPTIAAPMTGVVQLAISPWGHIDVDGANAGVTPPLSRLSLPVGEHVITVRNDDFPPYTTTVRVNADQPVVVRHRFGS